MKRIVLPIVCSMLLAACQSGAKKVEASKDSADAGMEITGSATSAVSAEPMVQIDPSVTRFPLEGPVENPMTVNRGHGVLDNTTSGGYTVFDDSVRVYPLPGENVPNYMPEYAVPPLADQRTAQETMVGQPMGLASAGLLPPVPNVDVKDADPYANPPVPGMYSKAALANGARQPLSLTAPEPVTMQPPAKVRAPMLSPFGDDDAVAMPPVVDAAPRGPMLTGADERVSMPVKAAPAAAELRGVANVGNNAAAAPVMTPGRRSGPSLTGY